MKSRPDKKFILLRTLGVSPSDYDTVGIVSNWSAWNTDRLHVVVERQGPWQAYYSDVIVIAILIVLLVHYNRNASECLSFSILCASLQAMKHYK